MTIKSVLNILFLCLLIGSSAFAQEKESDRLKKKQAELEKKIAYTETLLKSTSDSKKNLSDNIGLLERKIDYRKDLLDNIKIQVIELENDIANLDVEIARLELEIVHQKDQLKLMIQQAYKMRNSKASLLFILSSESFNQANARMEYLDQLTKYRANQIQKITLSKQQLEAQLMELAAKKEEKSLLAQSQEVEQQRYVRDRENQKKAIEELQGKEQQLQDELKVQRDRAKKIQNEINAAINREILARRKKEKETPRTMAETKEIELSNKGFEDNKGRLPWPVKKGEITKGFGKQPHPVHKTVYTYNNGVDITTVKGSTVRSVYSGEVTSVIVIPGAGKAVIIAHGNYRTIYSNLAQTYVEAGDKVTAKQEIGALLVNGSGNSEVHFEIRKITDAGDISNINPTYWLYR